jgi:hypothetical protein
MRFKTTVLTTGKTAAGFRVPTDVVAALGAGRNPKVNVTINGKTYRSSIATIDGAPMVGLSAENRALTGAQGGDEIEVEITLDTAPREIDVPPDLAAALDAEPAARATFDNLSYTNKSWHTYQLAAAKSAETRQRRIEKSVAALREGKPR